MAMLTEYGREIDGIFYSFMCDKEYESELLPLIDFLSLMYRELAEDGLAISLGFVVFRLSKLDDKNYKVVTWDYTDNDILVVYTEDLTVPAKIMRGQKRVSDELGLPMTEYLPSDLVLFDKRLKDVSTFAMQKKGDAWHIWLTEEKYENDTWDISNMDTLMAAEMYAVRPEIMDYLLLPDNYLVVFENGRASSIYDGVSKEYSVHRDGRIELDGEDKNDTGDIYRRNKWHKVQFRDYGRSAPIC